MSDLNFFQIRYVSLFFILGKGGRGGKKPKRPKGITKNVLNAFPWVNK